MSKKIIEKYNRLPNIVKGTFWFTVASFFQRGLSAITTPIFTRLMTTAEYGAYNTYVSWHNIFLVLCTLNLSTSILNSLLIKEKDNRSKVISSVCGFEIALTILVFLCFIIYDFLGGPTPGLNFNLGLLMFAEILSDIPISLWLVKQKFDNNYKAVFLILIQSILSIGLSVIVVIFSDDKVSAKIYGKIIVSCIFMIICFIFISNKSKKFFDKNIWKKCLVIGGPLIFHFLAQSIMGQSDKLVISYFWGDSETGIYSIAHSISWLLYIFVTAVNASIIPWIYKKIKINETSSIKNTLIVLLLILGALILLVSVFSPELIFIFGGKEYIKGTYYIAPLSITMLFIFMTSIFSNYEFYYQKTKLSAVATIFGAILNIALNIWLIPIYGGIAACYTTLISYMAINVSHFFVCKHILKKYGNMELSLIMNYNIMYLITIIFVIFILLSQLLFDYLIVRICILCLIVLMFIIFRKKINNVLRKALRRKP